MVKNGDIEGSGKDKITKEDSSYSHTWINTAIQPSISNQPDFSSQLQVQRLRQDLDHAQKQIQAYENRIASLYITLHNVEKNICVNCKAHLEKYATSAGLATSSTARTVSPSSKPEFALPRSSDPPRSSAPSNRVPFWHRGHHTPSLHSPSRPTDSVSVNSDITERSGATQFSSAKAPDFIQSNQSASVSSESTQQPSLPVTQLPISSTPPKDIPNQLDRWSVDFNSNVKRVLNVKLEHVLTPGAIVGRVRFSPDGEYLAVGVNNGRTYVYDVKTVAKSFFLVDNSETRKLGVWSLCFSPDGKYLAVGVANGQIRIWEIAKKRSRNVFREHTETIKDLDFSPDGRFLVSCSYDKTVRIWRMRDGFCRLLEDNTASTFYSVRFNPDGRYIAAGNDDGMLRIWSVRTSQLVEKWSAHGKIVRSVVFTLDGKGLVSSSGDDTWKYWDISFLELAKPEYGMTKGSKGGQKCKATADTSDVSPIAISPDGQWVVSGSADHTVRIWDLRNAATMQCALTGHRDRVWSVDFCPTGNYLASGGRDGWVALCRYEAALKG